MKNRTVFISLIISLLLFQASAIAATPAHQLKTIITSIRSMQGRFTQTVYNAKGTDVRKYSGSFAILKPNRFCWEITHPVKQLIVADGRDLWVYEPSLKQASVQRLKSGSGATPAMILSSKDPAFLNNFFIRMYKGWFVLTPKITTTYQQVKLRFQGNRIQTIQLFDSIGQATLLNFSHLKVNQRVNKTLFQFRPPQGVDVVSTLSQ